MSQHLLAALPVLAFLALAVVIVGSAQRSRRTWASRLRAFADQHLEGATFRQEGGYLVPAPTVRGRFRGREVSVAATLSGSGKNTAARVRYGVAIGPMPLSGRVDRAQLEAHLTALAKEGEQERELRAALGTLFGVMGADTATIVGGWLRVDRELTDYALGPTSLQRGLEQMVQVASLWDADEVATPDLGIRVAWTGGESKTMCPFCRDDLDPTSPESRACESCRTLHHAECLVEAGGCTVLGCASRQTRARDRA